MSTTQILDAPPPPAVSTPIVSPSAVSAPIVPRPRPASDPDPAPAALAAPAPPPAAAPAAPIAPVEPRRDRLVDVLRIFAVVVVVAEHWLMPVLSYEGGRLHTGNAYAAVPGAWAITWIGQVMPLVFFAGGAAAAMSLTARRRRHGDATATTMAWLGDRLRRLAWPVLPLTAVWVPLPYLLDLLGLPDGPVHQASRLVGQLIWFLAVYVVVIALTPALIRAHRRWRGLELVALAAAAVLVDVVRFGILDGATTVGYANLVFVWATVYHLGVVYGSGGLARWSGGRALEAAAAGFGVTALAVLVGPYPLSMIGMPGAPVSNMNPPTAVLLSLAVGQLGLALALRPMIERWAARTQVARGIEWISQRLMTVYLWHMPALVVVAGVAIVGFGWSTPEPFGDEWRDAMPVWVAALAAVLAVMVRGLGRFEHPRAGGRADGRVAASRPRVRAAVVLIGLGLLSLTVNGFGQAASPLDPAGPLAATAAVGLGLALLHDVRVTGSPAAPRRERLNS